MSPVLFLGLVTAFFGALAVGRLALVRSLERRVQDWARAGGLTLERCERALDLAVARPTWRVRVVDASGERREAWVRAGWSSKEPVDVLWAAPGTSVFR